jgi:glycosyltransferase involved in cell wall biosynthesis
MTKPYDSKVLKIFVATDYFLPGYRGGGPIKTLSNMRTQMAGYATFSIFTRDRDLGSNSKYSDINSDTWSQFSEGNVYYASRSLYKIVNLKTVISSEKYDIFYLNSFFSFKFSILLYLFIKTFKSATPVLIAPRGEFSAGALKVKCFKKFLFLCFARLTNFYRDVFWHASTDMEAADILRQFPTAKGKIYIVADSVMSKKEISADRYPEKKNQSINLVFISRIAKIKNLDTLLNCIGLFEEEIKLDIFGPIEDKDYWLRCKKIISNFPRNKKVRHRGDLHPDAVSATFSRYDLFVLPSRGENFGHVVLEALQAGTPVIVSDRTPWQPDKAGSLKVIALNDFDSWYLAIKEAIARTAAEQRVLRKAAVDYANQYIQNECKNDECFDMFKSVSLNNV